jgi:hypothetical protein
MTQEDHASDAVRFVQLVAMFQMAAMQAMGKLINPVTEEVELDLDQARGSIEMLEMLQRRTEGNRTAEETELFEKILFELRMNFVDESRRGAEDSDVAEDDADEAGADADEAGADADAEGDRPDGEGPSGG